MTQLSGQSWDVSYHEWGCGAGLQSRVVEYHFEYPLLVCIYVAVRGLFLYLKLLVICNHCTPTGSDSHSNITHFINFFVYRSPDVCESAEG